MGYYTSHSVQLKCYPHLLAMYNVGSPNGTYALLIDGSVVRMYQAAESYLNPTIDSKNVLHFTNSISGATSYIYYIE